MAIMRIVNQEEAIEPLDIKLLQQIMESNEFYQAQQIWREIETMSFIPIPDHELGYIYMHLVALLNPSS